MQLFIEQVFNGLAEGSIYALISLGLTLVYGVLRILHVAHAGIYTIGAYVGLFTYNLTGSLVASLFVSMTVCAILGILIEKYIYYPLLKYPPYVPLIAGIAIYLAIEEVCRLIAGPYIISFPAKLPFESSTIMGITITAPQKLIFMATIIVLLFQWFLVTKTETGLAMRCTSQDIEIAGAMGINTQYIISLTFAIGSAVAAIAGILVGIHDNQVYPTMGEVPAYKSLAIIVLGGLGSVPGAVIASLLLGVIEALLVGYVSIPLPREALAFIAMIIVFMIKPEGLIGKN